MVSIRGCTNEILHVIFGLAIQEGGSYALDLALACHHFEPIGLYHTYESLCYGLRSWWAPGVYTGRKLILFLTTVHHPSSLEHTPHIGCTGAGEGRLGGMAERVAGLRK